MTWLEPTVVTIALAGCVHDVRTRRIPNAITLPAAVAGVAAGALMGGAGGAALHLAGWAVGLALFLPFFVLRGMGGGDVKLLAALGAWVGPGTVVSVAMWAALCGGLAAVALIAKRRLGAEVLHNLTLLVRHWRWSGPTPCPAVTLEAARGPRLAYAVPITAGLMVALWTR